MSEQLPNSPETPTSKITPTLSINENKPAPVSSRLAIQVGDLLESGDAIVYAIVGVCFVLGAILALGYTFWDFGTSIGQVFNPPLDETTHQPIDSLGLLASTIITLVSNLLLALIIMEVLGTVIQYLKAHVTSLTPFLSIGIISATRGILSIGARLSVEKVEGQAFNNAMIELGVNAFVILALGLTLTFLNRNADKV